MRMNATSTSDTGTGMRVDQVVLASPRGFCAGVEMAIKALAWMVETSTPPVYCYHEIVHNQSIVRAFEDAGVVFVSDIAEVPPGAPLMLSAHGSAPDVVDSARARGGFVVDAVCPLVTKVHHEVKTRSKKGFEIIYVGHDGHDEAVGTIAVAPQKTHLVESVNDVDRFEPSDGSTGVALLAQTTLSHFEWAELLDKAKARFPDLWLPGREDLCYATTNRQKAVQLLAHEADAIFVVGSENSSNTRALVKVAVEAGCDKTRRIDDADEISDSDMEGVSIAGVTAGASAPENLVDEVIERLNPISGVRELAAVRESEYFPLPPALRERIRVERPASRRQDDYDDREWTASMALRSLKSKDNST